jgi:hypothetical protein
MSRSKLVYPGGWVRTTYAHKHFGRECLRACVECGRATCATVWVHQFDRQSDGGRYVRASDDRRVVRCAKHPPPEIARWGYGAEPSLIGQWSRRMT